MKLHDQELNANEIITLTCFLRLHSIDKKMINEIAVLDALKSTCAKRIAKFIICGKENNSLTIREREIFDGLIKLSRYK